MSRQYRKVVALGILALSFLLSLLASADAETIATTADTALRRASPNVPGNNDGWMHVNPRTMVLLAFDNSSLAGMSAAAGMTKATLQATSVPAAFRDPGYVEVLEVVEPWQDTTATWNNTPATGRVIASMQVNASQKSSVLAFDVTAIVNDWLANPTQNHGLMLRSVGPINIAVYSLESMGGAFAATLDITTPNVALVASHGGDYDNPADAADDAAAWCDPEMEAPCTVLVAPGRYLVDRTITLDGIDLAGNGRAVTELRAGPGVSPVVLATSRSRPTTVSKISIVNHQAGGNAGAIGVDGLEPIGGGTTLFLSNVRISVIADGPSHAASAGWLDVYASELEVASNAEVTLIGASAEPYFRDNVWAEGHVILRNSTVLVTGGAEAFGARGSDVGLHFAHIGVHASQSAHEVTGIRAEHRNSDATVFANYSTIDTRGSGGRQTVVSISGHFGCLGRLTNIELLSDGATPDSSALRVMNDVHEYGCGVTVRDSRLQGGLELPHGTSETVLTFDNVLLEGAKFVRATTDYVVRLLDSRAAGSIEFGGAELSCTDVFDAEFVPRDSNCQPTGQ